MPIDPASRYSRLPAIVVETPDGAARVMGAPRAAPEPAIAGEYQVREGDRLDHLGRAATGDTTRWWVLADANPWADATTLEEPGTTIRLPGA